MATTSRDSAQKTPQFAAERARIILYAIAALISVLGLADATYLTVTHLTGDNSVCGESAGCSAVLGSVYASVAGIPTAAFGALAYFAAFSSAILAAFGYARARILLMLVVASMFAITLGLLYVQAFVLHAFCPFCLLSAALIFLLAGLVVAIPSSR
ncbi:MAG: vitamin K epoxide reductase family protein [Candidatus Acidiferrum sp.]